MACKRGATSELNHDNWNAEDEPEEAGTFAIAPEDVLKKRVVRTAKRRLPSGEASGKSAFGGFSGFKNVSTPTASPFSFLSKTSSTETSSATKTSPAKSIFANLAPASNGSTKSSENGLSFPSVSATPTKKPESPIQQKNKEEVSKVKDNKIFKQSSDYYAELKGLNESVASWIKKHVDANPFCILSPIFMDYEKYVKEIDKKHGKEGVQSEKEITQEPESDSAKRAKLQKMLLTEAAASREKDPEEKKAELIFKPTTSCAGWNPDKTLFGNTSSGATMTFGKSHGKSVFGNSSPKENPFLNKSKENSAVGDENEDEKLEKKALTFPSTNPATFSFGQNSSGGAASASFSFGGGKPFSFGAGVVAPVNSENKESEEKEDEDEPPKVESKPVTEEGANYEKRIKLFVKKDGTFGDRGVGILFLKPTPSGKTQLIVRADNSLGNLLLNTLLTESIPTKRMNKNTVMLVCLPLPDSQPPPVPVLLRVKTSEDADDLLKALDDNKK